MKVLVLGAAGRLGSRLVEAGQAAGHEVSAFVRERSKLEAALAPQVLNNVRVIVGDSCNPSDLRKVGRGAGALAWRACAAMRGANVPPLPARRCSAATPGERLEAPKSQQSAIAQPNIGRSCALLACLSPAREHACSPPQTFAGACARAPQALQGQDAVVNSAGYVKQGAQFSELVEAVVHGVASCEGGPKRLWVLGGAGACTLSGAMPSSGIKRAASCVSGCSACFCQQLHEP